MWLSLPTRGSVGTPAVPVYPGSLRDHSISSSLLLYLSSKDQGHFDGAWQMLQGQMLFRNKETNSLRGLCEASQLLALSLRPEASVW